MSCRYDREREEYLRDGEPCRTDDYGDPTHHCTAKRRCANHIGHGELTCARCLGETRADIRAIVLRSPELTVEALVVGVDSEAANLAGPAADYRVLSARRVIDKRWISDHIPLHNQERAIRNLIPDDDEHHPYGVLTRWAMMLAEDYRHALPAVLTIGNAAAYLERTLPRLAQDDEQDFPHFAREIRRCRRHIEAVLRDSQQPERGAPCPTCPAPAPKLHVERGHHCDEADCDRLHWPEDPDRWVCPRNREHWWTETDYRRWVADVYDEARRSASA